MSQTTPVQIRDAGREDVPVIARYSIDMALETQELHLDRSAVLDGVQAVVTSPELGRYFLAVLDAEVIGQALVTYEWSDWRCGLFWWLQSIYVKPDVRRCGAFTTLYQHVRDMARETPGVVGIRLHVDEGNDFAHTICTRMGLEPCGKRIYADDWSTKQGG